MSMLAGNRVLLREIEESDLDLIVKWRNDPEVLRYLFSYLPISSASQRQWYQRYLTDDRQQTFVIVLKDENKPVGTIGLSVIDHRDQKAELGIMIGEKGERGKGVGEEALRLLIGYAFTQMNLRKIKALAFADNETAIRLYEKCGFRREGLLKEEAYKDGRFKDVCVLGLLRG
jgi:UDP-4-amino-4,6-dideoxy-N-acetyl-beta-L-altrosamine N-acetyltransferase